MPKFLDRWVIDHEYVNINTKKMTREAGTKPP